MIDHLDHSAEYEFFGKKTQRDHKLCPHCGNQGYTYDNYDITWDSGPSCHDDVYLCASCQREWIIRTFRYTGYEKYPGPANALIYIPEKTRANEGQHGGDSGITFNDDIP